MTNYREILRLMLDNNTVTKLHELKLSTMAASFAEQFQSNGMVSLSFEERFGLLVDAEWLARKNNRLAGEFGI